MLEGKGDYDFYSAIKIRNRKTGDTYKAVIIKVQTFYGPVPAVFTINKENVVNFVGYSSIHGRIREQLMSNKTNKKINYWKSKIPSIIQ